MNVLVLNGSPRGEKSNTLRLASAFVAGLTGSGEHRLETLDLSNADIGFCRGCFACWQGTPGTCVAGDAMADWLDRYRRADCVVWSFPLYHYGMPAKIKAFMERLLPLNLPDMAVDQDGRIRHPSRYDLSGQRHILVSTCGFPSLRHNYEALVAQFDLLFGERLTAVLCPEGELFRVPQLAGRTAAYLELVKEAGREYGRVGSISAATAKKLAEPLLPPDAFMEAAGASWEKPDADMPADGKAKERAIRFLKQMAAVYTPAKNTRDAVLEFHFTDIGETFQLLLGREICTLLVDSAKPYTTRIETPFALWQKIAIGAANGSRALMERRYRVLGDFSLMADFHKYFSGGGVEDKGSTAPAPTRTNMLFLLVPWLALWVMLSLNSRWAGAAGIAVSALVPIAATGFRLTVYDRISCCLVALLGTALLVSAEAAAVSRLSYALFALPWLCSGFLAIPLSAHYSKNRYGGDRAFANPMFIRTNRILSVAWGALFLVIAILYHGAPGDVVSRLLVFALCIAMSAFTLWFSRWYPAMLARRIPAS